MNVQVLYCNKENPENLDIILELQSSSINLLSSKNYNTSQIESLIKSQKYFRTTSKEIVLAAYLGSKLIGFVSLLVNKPHVGAIFVHPDFARQGIGTILIEAIEKTAIKKKHRNIYTCSSLSAVDFYLEMGYKITHKSGFWSEGKIWIPCVKMQKQLIFLSTMEKWKRRVILIIACLVVVVSILIASVQ